MSKSRETLILTSLLLGITGCSDSPTEVVVPAPPVRAATGLATSINATFATLNATVYPKGEWTTYFFELGTTTSYGTRTSMSYAGGGTDPVPVTEWVSGLIPGTLYHFRVVAVIPAPDTIPGGDRTFRTIVTAPLATLGRLRVTSTTSIVLEGSVNPMALPTWYLFEYGVTSSYGQSTSPQDAGSGMMPVSVSAPIGNLIPLGSYHWRLVAVNSGGTAATPDSTFSMPVDLEFPLAVGTIWTYRFTEALNFFSAGIQKSYKGVHVWEIVSVSHGPNSTVYSVNDSQTDTAHNIMPQGPDVITSRVTPFTIVEIQDSLALNFPEGSSAFVHTLSRFVQPGGDTLSTTQGNGSSDEILRCVRGIGVIDYTVVQRGNNPSSTVMTLLSFSKP